MISRQSDASIRPDEARKSGRLAKTAAAVFVALSLIGTAPAVAEEYDPKKSAHPLRILAYVVHPVGFILDALIFRPLHWIGSQPYVKPLVGQKDK